MMHKNFPTKINKINKNIQFTIEHQENNSLVFLDSQITHESNKFDISWHLKSTNTGVYINRHSYSPNNYKHAAIRSLLYRAIRIFSNKTNFEDTYRKVKLIFINNGYNYRVIEKIKEKLIAKLCPDSIQNTEKSETKFFYLRLPF